MSIESYEATQGYADGRQAYEDALRRHGLYEESRNLRQSGWYDNTPPTLDEPAAHPPTPPIDSLPNYSRRAVRPAECKEEWIVFATSPPETVVAAQSHLASAHFGSRLNLQPETPAQQPPNPINVTQRFLQAARELTMQPPLEAMYWLQDTAMQDKPVPHTPESIAASTRAVAVGAHAVAAQVAEQPYSSAPNVTERFLARVYYEVAPVETALNEGKRVSDKTRAAATELVAQARKEAAEAYELLKCKPEATLPVTQAQKPGQTASEATVTDISRSAPSRRGKFWGRLPKFGKRAARGTGERRIAA